MRKTLVFMLACAMLCVPLVACSQGQATNQQASSQTTSVSTTETSQAAEASESSASAAASSASDAVVESSQTPEASASAASATATSVSNAIAEDEDALVATYASKFTQETYTDTDTGLSVTYNLFLPQGYDETRSYPMVVFIADSSCAGADAGPFPSALSCSIRFCTLLENIPAVSAAFITSFTTMLQTSSHSRLCFQSRITGDPCLHDYIIYTLVFKKFDIKPMHLHMCSHMLISRHSSAGQTGAYSLCQFKTLPMTQNVWPCRTGLGGFMPPSVLYEIRTGCLWRTP